MKKNAWFANRAIIELLEVTIFSTTSGEQYMPNNRYCNYLSLLDISLFLHFTYVSTLCIVVTFLEL